MTENETMKALLEGQTIIIVTVKKVGDVEIEPMIVVEKVDNGMIVTSEGTYTGNRHGSVDYHDRAITFKGIGDSVVSRTFKVLNLAPMTGTHYRPYANQEDRQLWLKAEEDSWSWGNAVNAQG